MLSRSFHTELSALPSNWATTPWATHPDPSWLIHHKGFCWIPKLQRGPQCLWHLKQALFVLVQQTLSKFVFPVPISQVVTQGRHKPISKPRQHLHVSSPGAAWAFLTKFSALIYFSRSCNNERAYWVWIFFPTAPFVGRDCFLILLSCCWLTTGV